MSVSRKSCPFCNPSTDGLLIDGDVAMALWDRFPLNPGHVLVVPRRHFGSWFDATKIERNAMLRITDEARKVVTAQHAPAAFNLGINDGPAAGQTVAHVHLHLIPRYVGDVADPRGGVRWVIPDRAPYWDEQ